MVYKLVLRTFAFGDCTGSRLTVVWYLSVDWRILLIFGLPFVVKFEK